MHIVIEIKDELFDVNVTHYSLGHPGSSVEPPAPEEVEWEFMDPKHEALAYFGDLWEELDQLVLGAIHLKA